MASKRSADRSPKATAAPAATPPTVRVPTTDDLDLARNDALLQLRIGQAAHYNAILVAIALFVDAGLVLYLQPTLSPIEPAPIRSVFFLLFPLIGGLSISAFGLRVKWETYQLWPWETHFWSSIAAVAFNVFLAYLYAASVLSFGPTQSWKLLPWFYPAVLAGLSLALIGLGLTWSEWSQKKTTSVGAALLPIPLAFVLYLSPSSPLGAVYALSWSLTGSALLYLISGGFLHLISSGTRTHEREVITSGQSRLFQVADEVRKKEEALRFREATLLRREADAEDAEDSFLRQRESLAEAKAQLDHLETDLQGRAEALRQAEAGWSLRAAETNTAAQKTQDRDADLQLREKDLTSRLPKVAEREQMLLEREGDQRRREVEIARREQELQRRLQGVPEGEADLERRRQEMNRRMSELLRKESEMKTRETSAPGAPAHPGAPGGVEDREARMNQLKMTLDEQNLILGRRARQVDESLKDLLRREAGLTDREAGVAQREAALGQRETDAKDRYDLGEERRRQYEEALLRYEDKIHASEIREGELGARKSEMERQTVTMAQKEAQLREKEHQLQAQKTTLDRLQRVMAERQKGLDGREDELALKAQTLGRSPAGTSTAGAWVEEAPMAPAVVGAAPSSDLLAAPPTRRLADREPTGNPRLDDLLSGGIPAKGHVLVVGDAFVGKEVILYAFVAEGLKIGEDVILVTTARRPEELSEQIGLVSPQFREYEQLGKVRWIDASRPGTPGSGPPPATASNVTVVNGPDDHAGILKALVAAGRTSEAKSVGFRVAFFGLSAALAHSDERASMAFLQNLVGVLKPRKALAFYSLEAGSLGEGRLEQILARMDGAIRFKQERDKTFLSVAGFGEVATREWIECRATNRALVIGSFSLERIR